jgi:hypothetical protein
MAINKAAEYIGRYTRTYYAPLSTDFRLLQWAINLPSDYFGQETVKLTHAFRGDQYTQSIAGRVPWIKATIDSQPILSNTRNLVIVSCKPMPNNFCAGYLILNRPPLFVLSFLLGWEYNFNSDKQLTFMSIHTVIQVCDSHRDILKMDSTIVSVYTYISVQIQTR